jgi:hypothetical protein
MKRFIKSTALFTLPILLSLIIGEVLLRNIPNDYSYKKKYLDDHASEIKVLFLGSSHAYFGINPDFIKTGIIAKYGFNGAHVGQSLLYDSEIIKKYASKLNHLEYLIMPIDYFTIYSEGIPTLYLKNYILYYNIIIYGNLTDYFEILNPNDKLQQLRNYYVHNKDNITCNKTGWGTIYKSTDKQDLIKQGKIRAEQQYVPNDIFITKNIQLLNEIIAIMQVKNVKIIFYTSPGFYTYTNYLNPHQLNTTIDIIKKIILLKKNISYYNFLTDTTFTEEDFWDGNHLNEIGAKKLTLKLDSIIENKAHGGNKGYMQ